MNAVSFADRMAHFTQLKFSNKTAIYNHSILLFPTLTHLTYAVNISMCVFNFNLCMLAVDIKLHFALLINQYLAQSSLDNLPPSADRSK